MRSQVHRRNDQTAGIKDLLGRILSGAGEPLDGGPRIVPEDRLDITGASITHTQDFHLRILSRQAYPPSMV